MHQASSFWQKWTSPASTSNATTSSASQSALNSSSSPISELNATSDPANDQDGDIYYSKDVLTQAGSAARTHLSPVDHLLTKENSRHNSTSSGSSHQTFSSIPGPSDRPSPVQTNSQVANQQSESNQQQRTLEQQQQDQQRGAIGSSAAASNSNEDFFFDRDPLLLPRRNHTIGAGTTPNRKRMHSHFLFPSEGPTSPGQNSLSAITGGKDTDDDEWEKMIKSREDLIPGQDDDLTYDGRGYASGSIPWQNNPSLAAASHHRRFPSQPSSVRAVSPYYSGTHSPLDSRGSYHQRSESARVRPLEQGPFASASTAGHSPESRFASLDPSNIRRHQSLNYATGRAMSGRIQSTSRRNLYADRLSDMDPVSPPTSFARDANVSPEQQHAYAPASTMTPADRSALAANGGLNSPEAAVNNLGSSPSTSTTLSTSLLDAHARLSRMTLQGNATQQLQMNVRETDSEAKRQLHSLITNRDALEGSSVYGPQGRRDIAGPASASPYVPPIGHGHHRRDDSPSNSSRVPMPKTDDQNYRHPQALQGPFSALPGGLPWAQQGSSLLNKPSLMGNHHLETAREESPRFDNNGFDMSQQLSRDNQHQSNTDTMAMNIALLQHRLLSQQHQPPATQMLHHQLHQHYQQPSMVQNPNPNPPPLHFSMTDPRQPGHISVYNPLSTEGSPFRTYSPQLPNNLQSMFQPSIQPNAPLGKGMPPSASQTISPALAAQMAEKGYNPTTAQFDTCPPRARFFVIKSFTEDDVQRSLKHEIWASTEKGNQRLDRAFKECVADGNVPLYLFYSVNASGHFCGMAQMMSPLDYSSTSNVWVQEGKWKGTFKVKWIFVKDVPNLKLRHIRLTNTPEQKPITQSRDTQELPTEGGREVLRIMAGYQSKTTLLQDWLFYEQQAVIDQQRKDGPSVAAT